MIGLWPVHLRVTYWAGYLLISMVCLVSGSSERGVEDGALCLPSLYLGFLHCADTVLAAASSTDQQVNKVHVLLCV